MGHICRSCLRASIKASKKAAKAQISIPASHRAFSILNRPPPNYEGHVPLTSIERIGMAVGSGLMAYVKPRRGDMIAVFGEMTAQPYFITRLRDAMLRNATGRQILRDRPRMNADTLPVDYLASCPENSVGRAYYDWLVREKLSPGGRTPVRYIDDEECAYVMQRYRESHDFYHALTGLPTVREGEVALKCFEFANTGLPMTGLGVLNVFTLKDKERDRFWDTYGPWAVRNGTNAEEVMNVYWEKELNTDVDELRNRLGIEKPPDLRDIRKRERDAKKASQAEAQTQPHTTTIPT